MESVDCWPMAITIHKTFGGKPKPVAAPSVTGGKYPPLEGLMLYAAEAPVAEAVVSRTVLWGTQWGQLDGLWEPVVALRSRKLVVEVRSGVLRLGELLCPYSVRGFAGSVTASQRVR